MTVTRSTISSQYFSRNVGGAYLMKTQTVSVSLWPELSVTLRVTSTASPETVVSLKLNEGVGPCSSYTCPKYVNVQTYDDMVAPSEANESNPSNVTVRFATALMFLPAS